MRLLVSADADESISRLNKKFGLHDEFFSDLVKGDDWSFIIKLHAFIEAAVTQTLVAHFKEPKLINAFSRMELSNNQTGKLAFCRESGLIGDDYRRLIAGLSELRNQFVHNVEYCNKSLMDVVNDFDGTQIQKFIVDFNPYNAKSLKVKKSEGKAMESSQEYIKQVKRNPKDYIWHGCYTLMLHLAQNEKASVV